VRLPRELLTDRLRLRQWEDADVEHMPAMDREATTLQVARFRRRWGEDGFSRPPAPLSGS
jgi:hypothetical protein